MACYPGKYDNCLKRILTHKKSDEVMKYINTIAVNAQIKHSLWSLLLQPHLGFTDQKFRMMISFFFVLFLLCCCKFIFNKRRQNDKTYPIAGWTRIS